jgi:hypothetical protein
MLMTAAVDSDVAADTSIQMLQQILQSAILVWAEIRPQLRTEVE